MSTRTQLRHHLGNRMAVVAAGTAGFLLGAAGLAAAQIDPAGDEQPPTAAASVATEAVAETSLTLTGAPATTARNETSSTVTDASSTTIDVPDTTIDGIDPSTSVPTSHTTNTTNTTDGTVTSSTVTSNTVTSNTVADASSTTTLDGDPSTTSIDDRSSTSVPDDMAAARVPAPFTETYASAGGTIVVTWSGTALSLDAVSPAPGFRAEIEDQRWDRIRVDFENDRGDARIEVRLNDGRIRVRTD